MKAVVSYQGNISMSNDMPQPQLEDGFLLVQTAYSAISPGTEMMMNGHYYSKPFILGYSAAGIVKETKGDSVTLKKGQRVACYGAPYVKHAELLAVPRHLAVPIPDHVSLEEASTVGLGAIAIHSLRQANLQFGELLLLIGAGILGQITAQIAQAAGYQVILYDLLEERCRIAKELGIRHVCSSAKQVDETIKLLSDGEGVDASLICASDKTGSLMDHSLERLRDRGKVIVVGDMKMEFKRELMFTKEAQILISRAGGPGRYDPMYEKQGIPYPVGYIRWTEGRNMAEYIRLLAEGAIQVAPLLTNVHPVDECAQVYEQYRENPHSILGAVLQYPLATELKTGQEVETTLGR
ncbi:zinc-dependent alcohol dehydrogenase [Paenibacillus senegalensis]|uniref:zinc-dependent alcohol dehydrogenase n=1 Tax=Paenibacillus senegalensis TaxID=1465766 RepID=UPI000289F774|nr:zinc-binding alcohol dehydrogenase [Paenibacillus senegalensis]